MTSHEQHFEHNEQVWQDPGGPQDLFFTRDRDWLMPRIVRGEDIYLWDDGGNRYIDVSSGPVASNLGHGNERITNAIKRQLDKLEFSYCRVSRTDENIALADALAAQAGPGFERAFFVSGGSEAIDMAIKFARQVAWSRGDRERNRLFSLMPSYHGGTMGALALSGDLAVQEIFADLVVVPERIDAPLTYRPPNGLTQKDNEDRILSAFESRIEAVGPESCLALFVEPVGGLATGCNVLSGRFLRGLRGICDRHGLLLVFDEVMAGAGRTGEFLAAHHHRDALPDIVVLAKGIGAGYTPLGVMLASSDIVDALATTTGFNFGHTAAANPIACAVGLAAIEELESRNLIHNAAETGAYFRAGLERLAKSSAVVGDVRGKGLLLAVEIVSDKTSKSPFGGSVKAPDAIRRHGFDHGLTIYARRTNNGRFGDWIMTSPPLITTQAQADEILNRLEKTLSGFADEMVRSGERVA